MSSRANVLVKESNDDTGVYLYTHWTGSRLPLAVQRALKKRLRWGDAQYLARIIFDVMTEGQHDEETGFGISSTVWDGADRVLVVNCQRQTVSRLSQLWSFKQYVALSVEEITAVWRYGESEE